MQQPDQVEIKRKPNSKTYEIEVRSRSRSRELRNSRLSFGPVQSQNGVVPVPVVVVVANSKSSKSGSGGNRVSSRKINDAINNSSIIKRRRRSASLRDDFNVSGTSGEEDNGDDDDHDDDDDEKEKKKRPRSKEQTAEEKSISADSPIDSARIRDTTGHTHKDKAPRQNASGATTPSTATGTTHVYTIPQLPRFNFIPATPLPLSPAAILEKQLGDHSIALLSTAITEEAGASTSAETATTVAATATAETDTSDFQAADTDESKSKRPSMIRSSTLRDSRLHPWWRPRRGYYDYEDANLAKLLEGTAFDAVENGLEYSTSGKPPTPKTEWREYGPLKVDKKRKLVGVAGVQIQWVGLGGWYERFWGGKKDQKSEKENQEKSKENEKRKDEGKIVNGEKGQRRDSLAGSTRRGNTEGEQERNVDEDEIIAPQERKVEVKKVSSSNRKVWISYEVPKSP